jgi:hypothetical protein
MKKHSGMRPQDVVVLLKMVAIGREPWRIVDLASTLHLSQSEVSEALNRNRIAGLVDEEKRHLHRASLLEFLLYGLKYVFPAQPGPVVRGMPTAYSAPPLASHVVSGSETLVWPYDEGRARGQSIEPLYRAVPQAAREDKELYELLALTDALRVGRSRERLSAASELKRRFARS